VEVAGVEPVGVGLSIPVNKRDEELSPEALTEILTEIFGEDSQILARILERWGSLSDELKKAVLRVCGVGGKIASISQRQFLSGCLKFGQISHWVAFHFPMG